MHSKPGATQRVDAIGPGGSVSTLELPAAATGVGDRRLSWGDACVPATPAYWAAQTWMWSLAAPDHFRLGRTLEEELLACMLGGHGMPAEVGLAAYERLRAAMHASPAYLRDRDGVRAMLAEPLRVRGRQVRYRFANQKADYVADAFSRLADIDPDAGDRKLRDDLTRLRGVGPKTASWVLRNLRGSDEVAILDVHILRAGSTLGIFAEGNRVERDYLPMEEAYLDFARAIGARASILDSVIWMTMRQLPSSGRTAPPRPPATRRRSASGQGYLPL